MELDPLLVSLRDHLQSDAILEENPKGGWQVRASRSSRVLEITEEQARLLMLPESEWFPLELEYWRKRAQKLRTEEERNRREIEWYESRDLLPPLYLFERRNRLINDLATAEEKIKILEQKLFNQEP